MAFDDTPNYAGPLAALDEGTPNMMNSSYLQISVAASIPTAGNLGVYHFATDTLELSYDNGSAWVSIGHVVQFTAKGDIVVFDGTKPVVLAVGSDTQIIEADSGEASGLKYAAKPSGNLFVENLQDLIEAGVKKCVYALGAFPFEAPVDGEQIGWGFVAKINSGTLGASSVIPGGYKLASGSGTGASLEAGPASLRVSEDWTYVCRIAWADPTIGSGIGLSFAGDINPAGANHVSFRATPGGNIFGFVDNAGTETTRDSGQSADGSEHTLRCEISGGGGTAKFYLDNSQIGTDVTTNIPTATNMHFGLVSQSSSGSGDFADFFAWRDV